MGQTMSSADARPGEVVRLEVVEDVCVGNSVVIFSGTTASAVVTKMNSKKVKGALHQLALSVDSLNLADGTKALLRGTRELQGEKGPADEAKSRHLTFMPSAPPYPVVISAAIPSSEWEGPYYSQGYRSDGLHQWRSAAR